MQRPAHNSGILLYLVLVSVWFFQACSSDRRGVLFDRTGNPVAGSVVRLITVDDQGRETGEIATAVTDRSGKFDFSLSSDSNGSVLVTAAVSSGNLRGFFAGKEDSIPIHPLTDALVTLILDIAGSAGGPSVTDFSSDQIREITTKAFEADSSALDFTDPFATEDFLRIGVGRKIALAAGGTISSLSTASFETAGPTSAITFGTESICPIYNVTVISSSNFSFGVRPDGTLCGNSDGGSSMLDAVSMQLIVLPDTSQQFFFGGASFPTDEAATRLEGTREVTMGPQFLTVPGTVEEDTSSVTRKVFVPSEGDYVRYLESFSNNGSIDRDVTFKIRSTLQAGIGALLTHDRADSAIGTTDRFIAIYDALGDLPTVGFSYQDGLGAETISELHAPGIVGTINEVSSQWTETIPPGKTKTFVHFLYFTNSRSDVDVYATVKNLTEKPDMSGMTLLELSSLANFAPSRGTISGTSGSVVGKAVVTATNSRTGETLSNKAQVDGSFGIPLDTQSGDSIHVTASDGLDATVIVP